MAYFDYIPERRASEELKKLYKLYRPACEMKLHASSENQQNFHQFGTIERNIWF